MLGGCIRKERLQKKKACQRYQNFSEEEKNKKQQYTCERYRNLPEDEKKKKKKLAQYRKN